jgi:amylosucrase
MATIPTETAWATYVRCHDDIGWAVSDTDARAVGWSPFAHRAFLNEFFSGAFPMSYARGALFQSNPETGDARISGSCAALCGISEARERGDAVALDAGIRRHVLLHAVVFAWGGVPLLYMGDELALDNDLSYTDDPALAGDNRWMHRPWFDVDAAARRDDPTAVEGRVFGWMQRLARARRDLPALHAAGESQLLGVDDTRVLAWRRRHPRSGNFVGMVNFGEEPASVDVRALARMGDLETVLSSDGALAVHGGRAHLPALGFVWLAEA